VFEDLWGGGLLVAEDCTLRSSTGSGSDALGFRIPRGGGRSYLRGARMQLRPGPDQWSQRVPGRTAGADLVIGNAYK